MRHLLPAILSLAVIVPLSAAPRRRAVMPPPPFPSCSVITGSPAVTYTRDEGRTLAPVAERLQGTGYTYGVAALDSGALLSFHKLTLSISLDHGCSWRPLAALESVDFPPRIDAAPGGRAYVWSENRPLIARYDGRGLQVLKAPGAIVGLGIDPTNSDRLRAGTADGFVWESTNGGDTWDPIGQLKLEIQLLYHFAFDPQNLDHIVAGTGVTGALVTNDGGRTWTHSNLGRNFNAFSFAVSPVDSRNIWVMALDTTQLDVEPAHGRHLYRSTDGGLTYAPVVDEGPGVSLINGPIMAAHPRDPNVLYFVFGTYFQGYGTDLFRYDAAADRLTVTHNSYHGINAITFSRVDPNVMYLGLEHVVVDGAF